MPDSDQYLNASHTGVFKPVVSARAAHSVLAKRLTETKPAPVRRTTLQILQSLPAFSHVPPRDLQRLADVSRLERIAAGEFIVTQGDEESQKGFIVIAGRFAMMKTSVNGKEFVVELLAPGDMFGLILGLSHAHTPEQLSARAHTDALVLWVPIRSLTETLSAYPALYTSFLDHLLGSLQASYRISRGLAHDRVEVRIAAVLFNLGLKFSRPLPAVQDHTIDITRQQIADLTGTTIETAIRVTRAMQRDGLIDISAPGVVRLCDLPKLQSMVDSE